MKYIKTIRLVAGVVFSNQSLEGVSWDMLNEGVEFALALIIFVSSS